MCCGQKRTAMKSAPATMAPSAVASATQHVHRPIQRPATSVPVYGPSSNVVSYPAVSLRYLADSPILVRGSASGREYSFSSAQPVQPVEARDAEPLLRTRFFRRA